MYIIFENKSFSYRHCDWPAFGEVRQGFPGVFGAHHNHVIGAIPPAKGMTPLSDFYMYIHVHTRQVRIHIIYA